VYPVKISSVGNSICWLKALVNKNHIPKFAKSHAKIPSTIP
jgi:hypothetical protein